MNATWDAFFSTGVCLNKETTTGFQTTLFFCSSSQVGTDQLVNLDRLFIKKMDRLYVVNSSGSEGPFFFVLKTGSSGLKK